jgi:NAD(P)-dependent dehydrogenase (short-subunit alcohol dehydrogenase family)
LVGETKMARAISARLESRLPAIVVAGGGALEARQNSDQSAREPEHGFHLRSYEYVDIDDLVEAITSGVGPISMLVNVVLVDRSGQETDEASLTLTDELIRHASFLSHRIGHHLRQGGDGQILTVLCHVGPPNGLSARTYNGVLVGVRSLTAALARDWAGEGTSANLVVVPGLTGGDRRADSPTTGPRSTSVGPETIGEVVTFFATAGRCLNGQEIVVGNVEGEL